MELAYSVLDILLIYDERYVDLGCALADHVDVDPDVAERLEHFGCDARGKFQIFAHDTDNGLLALDRYFADRGKLAVDRSQAFGVVEGHRYRNLRSRHNIDGGLVAVKDGEDRAQKSIGLQHSG